MSKKNKIVKIDWVDHYSLGEEWYDADESPGERILTKVGFITSEDDMYYYISSLIDHTNDTYSQGLAILKNCIKSITTLTSSKEKE